MRDTSQFQGRIDGPIFELPRRMTFYEVCLASLDEGPGGDHLTELVDLREALESIYMRRPEPKRTSHVTLGYGGGLGAYLL